MSRATDLKLDDLVDITISGARVMYTTPDHSQAGSELTTLLHGGTRYVLYVDKAAVTIAKMEPPRAVQRISDKRVQEILDGLNGFVDREYDGGTHIAGGVAVPCATVVGCDANLDKAVDWALDLPEVSIACGPDTDGSAEIELVDGTIVEFDKATKRWEVTVSEAEPVCERGCIDGWASAECPEHGVKAFLEGVLSTDPGSEVPR